MKNTLIKTGHAIRNLTFASIDLYALFIILFLLARLAVGEKWWAVAMLNNFIQWMLLPAFVLIPLVLWQRRWITAGLFATQIAVFGLLFGGLFIPKSQATDHADLKVVTFNIASYRSDPSEIAENLLATNADIIGMQEVSVSHANYLKATMAAAYPYQFEYLSETNTVVGKLFFSRYPIVGDALFSASPERAHLQVIIDVHGTRIAVFVIHFRTPQWLNEHHIYGKDPVNSGEYDLLLERIDPTMPTIIIGDFNMTDQSDEYQRMTDAGLTDSFRETGWGFGATFPAHFGYLDVPTPLIRIDYVWISSHWTPLDAEVGADAGSDHLPLHAYLSLK